MPAEKSDEGLKRVVGITGLAASVVNLTIGVGIYALPAIIAIQLGPSAIIGYVLSALMIFTIILTLEEIISLLVFIATIGIINFVMKKFQAKTIEIRPQ